MIEITIPTLHAGQAAIYLHNSRFKAVRCGRRWGKTEMLLAIGCNAIAKGDFIGYFVPEHKFLYEYYDRTAEIMRPIKSRSSRNDGVFATSTGGRLDFWSLENELAGRSRKYHGILLDEIAFAKNRTMQTQWERAIKPTLLDYNGYAIAASTPQGIDDQNWFYLINHDPKMQFTVYHAPTKTNPYLPVGSLEALERDNHPLVYRQEYLAEFVDWSSAAFFSLDNLLINGEPNAPQYPVEYVYAVIDSAVKSGLEHDGTAVIYFAKTKHDSPLYILDYDVIQIDGALLETWLPNVYKNLEHFAQKYNAILGSAGCFIEDKSSGSILLQQAIRHGWQATGIDSKLTAAGKDERAINVSGYVYRGEIIITPDAYNRVITYKNVTKNHLLTQITGFRPGDKNAHKRADDALDCFCYGIAIALGNVDGY